MPAIHVLHIFVITVLLQALTLPEYQCCQCYALQQLLSRVHKTQQK